MAKRFDVAGVSFEYPTSWKAETEEAGGGFTAMLQGDSSAFLLVSLRPDMDTPAEVLQEALTALKIDYQTLDAVEVTDTLAGIPAIGHDIDFMTLDVTIHCKTRCTMTGDGPLLTMVQVSEYDIEEVEPTIREILATLQFTDTDTDDE